MKLERLIAELAPLEVAGPASADVTDLAYASDAVQPGALFFCVPGRKADGHAFAAAAVARGAAALVVERVLPGVAVPQLVVPSARAAMAAAADAFFGEPTRTLRVAGATGTNGKTTTAYLLASMLDAAGLRAGLLGTVESRIGGRALPVERTTPEAIDLQRAFRTMLDAGDRACAIEASSIASDLLRLERTRLAALVFTNLTQDHLDYHGTMEAYFAAKRHLFTGEAVVPGEPPPPAAVSVDDPWGRRLADELRAAGRAPLVVFGLHGAGAEVRPAGLELDAHGARFTVAGWGEGGAALPGGPLRSRLRGRFNVANVLGAVAAARLLGLPPEAVRAGVEGLAGVPGRFEAVDEGQPFAVVVDYAHTPDGLENVLATARDLAGRDGRVTVVFGAGGDRDRGKRPQMGRIAAALADRAIVTSDNPRSEEPAAIVAEVAGESKAQVEIEVDRRAAIALALRGARPGDVVLVAGKGHEQGQEVAGVVHPFDDRLVAAEELRRAGWGR